MIRIQDMTPAVYSAMSRDYQFISRLFDIVLNSVKTSTELVKDIPDTLPAPFINLLATTLGFQPKRRYRADQLRAICSVFSFCLRNKGNRQSIEAAVRAVMHAAGVKTDTVIISIDSKESIIYISTPGISIDTALLEDVFDYILPAGYRVNMVNSAVEYGRGVETDINVGNSVYIGAYYNKGFTGIAKPDDYVKSAEPVKHVKGGKAETIGHEFETSLISTDKTSRAIENTTANSSVAKGDDDGKHD